MAVYVNHFVCLKYRPHFQILQEPRQPHLRSSCRDRFCGTRTRRRPHFHGGQCPRTRHCLQKKEQTVASVLNIENRTQFGLMP